MGPGRKQEIYRRGLVAEFLGSLVSPDKDTFDETIALDRQKGDYSEQVQWTTGME
jgi:hypothetical protein